MLGLELFQTFALIHDDIMDADKTRRGGPTIHEQSGVNIAILAGDLVLTWADEQIEKVVRYSSSDPDLIGGVEKFSTSSNNIHVLALYQQMKEEVIYGQTLDVMRSIGADGIEKSRADELKTAWYSVVRPLQIGSSLALDSRLRGNDSILQAWERYGVAVGKLFQLRDDVLDGAVTEEACAKEAKDLRKQALAALEPLETSDEVKQLLVDFIQFVQSRNS